MILTVALNPVVDRTYTVPGFKPASVNLATQMRIVPGGKGINIARVAAALGAEVSVTGCIGGANGKFIEQELLRRGIRTEFVWLTNESRFTMSFLDPENGVQTVVLEPGPEISLEEGRRVWRRMLTLAPRCKVTVISGALPPGLPDDFFGQLIQEAKQNGAVPVLDASGAALVEGVKAKPFMIKPNRDELRELVPGALNSVEKVGEAAEMLVGQGIQWVIASMGGDGMVASCASGTWRVVPPSVKAIDTVGCGDALVAGCAMVLDKYLTEQAMIPLRVGRVPVTARRPAVQLSQPAAVEAAAASLRGGAGHPEVPEEVFLEAIKWGTAAAAASAMVFGAGDCSLEQVKKLLPEIEVTSMG